MALRGGIKNEGDMYRYYMSLDIEDIIDLYNRRGLSSYIIGAKVSTFPEHNLQLKSILINILIRNDRETYYSRL